MKLTLALLVVALSAPLVVKADRAEIPIKQSGDFHGRIPSPARCKSIAADKRGCDGTETIDSSVVRWGFYEAKGNGPCQNFGNKCFDLLNAQKGYDTAVFGCEAQPNRHAVRAFCTIYSNHQNGDGAIRDFTGEAAQRADLSQLKLEDHTCHAVFNDFCTVDGYPGVSVLRPGK